MEEVRIITMPFIITAIVLTFAMLYYDLKWKKKNPWWRQNDNEVRISSAERAYRQEERRKLNNTLMSWFAALFVIFGLMIIFVSARAYGGFSNIGSYWFYLIPFIGAVMFALSFIKRQK
jgi:ABC-type Fe3+ transport system permease subunit